MKVNNRLHYGLAPGLFPGGQRHVTADYAHVLRVVKQVIMDQGLVSISGPRGSGKTYALRAAVRSYAQLRLVEPLRLTRERLHLGDVERALVRDLSDESVRCSAEARSHQVRRVLGEAARHHAIVLLIDDAHVLHHHTLRGLKRLCELSWLGRAPLLGVILAGQRERTAAVPEVGLRADQLALGGLTTGEATAVLRDIAERREPAGKADPLWGDGAMTLIAAHERARNWLDLRDLVDACLAAARARQAGTVTADIARAALGLAPATGPSVASPAPAPAAVDQLLRRRAAPAVAQGAGA